MEYINFDCNFSYDIDDNFNPYFISMENKVNFESVFEDIISRDDINTIVELLDIVYRCRFLTYSQLTTYSTMKGITINPELVDTLVEYDLVQRCILKNNKAHTQIKATDTNTIYFISRNGISILSAYTDRYVHRWNIRDVVRSGKKIIDDIKSVDICLNLARAYGTELLNNLHVRPEGRVAGNTKIVFNVEFNINVNGDNKCFLIILLNDNELKYNYSYKLSKLESYIMTDSYKKSSIDAVPDVIFVCDNKEKATKISKMFRISSIHKRSRILTISRDDLLDENLFDNISFTWYDNDTNEIRYTNIVEDNVYLLP